MPLEETLGDDDHVTVEVKDVGSTKVSAPEEAKKKLS